MGATIPIDIATEAGGGFNSLKAVLGTAPAVYANREVRSRSPYSNPPLTNPSVGNRRHRKRYRKSTLTYSLTGDTFRYTSRRRGRTEVPERSDKVHRYPSPRLGAEFLPASLQPSKANCGLWLRSLGYGNLPTRSKTMERFPGSWTSYGRHSSITRFAHDPSSCTLVGIDKGNRWYTKGRWTST